MNRSIVRFLIAKLLLIEAALLVVPLIVALIYQEDAKVFSLNRRTTIFTPKKECLL